MKKLITIMAAVVLVAVFTVPVAAAEWNFYGSSRMATFRTNNDIGFKDLEIDDSDTTWDQAVNSRIGANVKFNDEIGGRFEMSESFGKRILYGTYNFGAGELLLGQTYVPSTSFYSNSVYNADGDLLGMGQFYTGRQEMVQLKMGGFKLALINPSTSTEYVQADAAVLTLEDYADDVDKDLPKIEVSYAFKTDMFFVDAYAGYQTYTADAEDDPATAADEDKDYDIDSYVVGIGGGGNFGPAYVKVGAHMGQNLGNYGAVGFLSPLTGGFPKINGESADDIPVASAGYDAASDKVVDNDGLGYLAVVGFKINEMFTAEIGYGHQEYEWDYSGAKDINAQQYYANCVITIAPGFFVVPEVGKVEYEIMDDDFGDFTYFGAKWQINF